MSLRPDPKLTNALLDWYDHEKRILPWRQDPSPYHVWISEVMLQQTQVATVIPYYHRFLNTLPTIPALAETSTIQLHKLWEGLGYYSRADNLRRTAIRLMDEYQGELPADYKRLLQLPGIGPYTAGAIASIAFGLPYAAVDGNVLRVLSRITASHEPINSTIGKKKLSAIAESVVPIERPGDFNQALMDLGSSICLAKGVPRCQCCPCHPFCAAYLNDLTDSLPKRTPKKRRRIEKRTIIVLSSADRIWIQQRPPKGLLAGLWEFLNLPGQMTQKDVQIHLKSHSVPVRNVKPFGTTTHLFTHLEWKMTGFYVDVSAPESLNGLSNGRWVTVEDLKTTYSLPSALHYFRNALFYPV